MSNPTDTKLEEIEGRIRADFHYSMTDDGMSEGIGDKACSQAVSDRAYLLSRVRLLEAAHKTLRASWDESLTAAEAERDRLRALLDAPVTEEEVGRANVMIQEYWGAAAILREFLTARRSK